MTAILAIPDPTELHDFLHAPKKTGEVRCCACRPAAQTFDVTAYRLSKPVSPLQSRLTYQHE